MKQELIIKAFILVSVICVLLITVATIYHINWLRNFRKKYNIEK